MINSLFEKFVKPPLLHLFMLYSEFVSPRWILERRFKQIYGYTPNIKNPRTHSEHILQRCINFSKEMSLLSDKVKVRDYVAQKIGAQYLVPAYFAGSNLTKEVFESLPSKFVIKANNSSGCNLIVRDKENHSYEALKKITDGWMKSKFYLQFFEMHYKNIAPALIVEKLLLDERDNVPNDYKIQYFRNGGNPKVFIQVESNRFSKHCTDIFDENWNNLNIRIGNPRSTDPGGIKKPENLAQMIELAKKLAGSFKCVRVDFYEIEKKLYFGEITFTPGAGMTEISPKEVELDWGRMWN